MIKDITKVSGMSNETGHFSGTLAAVLEKGQKYKVGFVTEKGYAESIILP